LRKHYSILEAIEEIFPTINKLMRSLSSVSIEFDDEQLDLIDISSISTSSRYPLNRTGGSDELMTGIHGEYIVYQYLLNKYRNQSNKVLIEWKNEREESHLPYDILLFLNGTKNYIEVKSTRTSNRHSFPLSIHQIEAILEHTENYFIYRVYLDENKLLILDKIKWRLQQKQHLSCSLTIESSSI
jgi:hypothetical protein